MSTRLWKNVVIGRHRISGGMPRGLAAGDVLGPRPVRARASRGGGRQQVGAELGDPVVVVADQDVAQPGPPLLAERLELVEVVDDGDRVARRRRGGPAPVTSCIHPLTYGVPIHSARSMPSACGPSVPQCRNTSWLVCAPRLSPKTTTRGRGPGPVAQPLEDAQPQSRFCSRASLTLPSDSGEGRLEYCMRDGGDVAAGEVLRPRPRRRS